MDGPVADSCYPWRRDLGPYCIAHPRLILPLLAKIMGGDMQSPLYLGKGEVNVPALFTSVLELCFAGIVGGHVERLGATKC